MIPDGCPMNNGGMTDRHVVTDQARDVLVAVQHRVVLNVGQRADPDDIKLGSDNDTEHDHCVCANRDMTVQLGTARNEGGWIDLRFGEFKWLHSVKRTRFLLGNGRHREIRGGNNQLESGQGSE